MAILDENEAYQPQRAMLGRMGRLMLLDPMERALHVFGGTRDKT